MAKGRKSRAEAAMVFLLLGNVIEGESILRINVSVCSVCTC
jgi:hypothetical protein